jgi:hypothetical protein
MKKIFKAKKISKNTSFMISGGTGEIQRETYVNRAKSATKIHNKMVQYIMS